MARVYMKEETLTAIANAIRERGETSDTYLPSQMATAINKIESATPVSLSTRIGAVAKLWPGWEQSTWLDLRGIVEDVTKGKMNWPTDITPGRVKTININGKDYLFELHEIVDNYLVFKGLTAIPIAFSALDTSLTEMWENCEIKHCVTNDKFFVQTKGKHNVEHDATVWSSSAVDSDTAWCVTPDRTWIRLDKSVVLPCIIMFAMGVKELGPDYNGRIEI